MAGYRYGVTLQPTVLAHEAWLKLSNRDIEWKDRRQFFAAVAVTMRNILIDHARKKMRIRHGGGQIRTDTDSLNNLPNPYPDTRLLLINEGVDELAKIDTLRAQVVVARFFGGLSDREIAENLGISERTVERHWAAAKVWLFRWIQLTGCR